MPKQSKRQARMRTTPLSVAFSLAERERVTEAAELQGESISAFIRAAAVKQAEQVFAESQAA